MTFRNICNVIFILFNWVYWCSIEVVLQFWWCEQFQNFSLDHADEIRISITLWKILADHQRLSLERRDSHSPSMRGNTGALRLNPPPTLRHSPLNPKSLPFVMWCPTRVFRLQSNNNANNREMSLSIYFNTRKINEIDIWRSKCWKTYRICYFSRDIFHLLQLNLQIEIAL